MKDVTPYDKGTCEIFLSECGIPLLNNSIETIGHKNSLKPHKLNECRNDCGDKQEKPFRHDLGVTFGNSGDNVGNPVGMT